MSRTEPAPAGKDMERYKTEEGRRSQMRQVLVRGGPLIVLLLLGLALSLSTPYFLTADNLSNVARQATFIAMLAIGQTVVIITRGIDISVAANAALAACISAVLMTQPITLAGIGVGPLHPITAIAIGMGVSTGVGATIGWIIARFGIPDFIATLGAMALFRGLALLVTDGLPVPSFRATTEGAQLPELLIWVGAGDLFGVVPVSAVLTLIMMVIVWWILRYTAFGRAVYAIGGNPEAARITGINIGRTKILAYALSGLTAGIAGIVLMGRLSSANALMGQGEELRSIASVVIGGTNLYGGEGGVIGSVIGALIITVLGNGLNLLDVSPYWQQVAQGAVIILVVVLDQVRRNRMRK